MQSRVPRSRHDSPVIGTTLGRVAVRGPVAERLHSDDKSRRFIDLAKGRRVLCAGG